jgi:hypothetical protein
MKPKSPNQQPARNPGRPHPPQAAAEAPAQFREIQKKLQAAKVPDPMSPWQIAGFIAGLICSLGPAPELAFDTEEDPDQILAMDCLDELSRRIEENDSPLAPEDLIESPEGQALVARLVQVVAETEAQLSAQAGHPVLAFAEAAAEAQDPSLADVPAARAYAKGLVRGLVMGVEDEDDMAGDHFGEALSLIFILTEEDLGEDFGSPAEVAEARQAVAAALPGLVAQLWTISHSDEEE